MTKLEFAKELQGRTKSFAVQIIKFYGRLPRSEEGRVLGRQSLFWLELMEDAGVALIAPVTPIKCEADALLRILATSLSSAKRNAAQ